MTMCKLLEMPLHSVRHTNLFGKFFEMKRNIPMELSNKLSIHKKINEFSRLVFFPKCSTDRSGKQILAMGQIRFHWFCFFFSTSFFLTAVIRPASSMCHVSVWSTLQRPFGENKMHDFNADDKKVSEKRTHSRNRYLYIIRYRNVYAYVLCANPFKFIIRQK